MPVEAKQPVLILGGFLITQEAYQPMATTLQELTGAEVAIVPMSRLDWLMTSGPEGWIRCLDRVDAMVRALQARSATGKVTLIGHSSGGVMLRPYLSDRSFLEHCYRGLDVCNRLITLGSPHQALRATRLRSLVDQRYPGCPHADAVEYVAVAGCLDLTSSTSSWFSRLSAERSYRQINGNGSWQGDGLVPLGSAHLRDARWITLDDTAHGGLFGSAWYGTPTRVERWWSEAHH